MPSVRSIPAHLLICVVECIERVSSVAVERDVDGVLAVDAVERLDVHNHHVTLRAVDGVRRAVDVEPLRSAVNRPCPELLEHVQHLAFCAATRQRCANQARIEQREHRFTSEASLLVVLV